MGGADLALLVVVLCALASVVVLFQTVSTQDRRSEENMAKDLLENLPVPVFVLDDDFRIIRYNGLFESLVGKALWKDFFMRSSGTTKSSMHYKPARKKVLRQRPFT